MDNINLSFTIDLIKNIKSKIPKKIQKYVEDSKDSYKYGYVRFDDDKLTSIYVYPNGPEPRDSWYSVLFKFDVQDGDYVFKYMYNFIENSRNNTFIEGRYDENMSLESKYTHYDERIPVKGGNLFCSKQKENQKINYIFFDEPKEFPEYLKYLKDNNIIYNRGEAGDLCLYGEKQNHNIKYLVIFDYTDK